MDFRTKKAIGKEIETDYEALNFGKGYDHNWVLNNKGEFAKVAEMSSEESGITMEVYTDLPGMQLYTGNFIVVPKEKAGRITTNARQPASRHSSSRMQSIKRILPGRYARRAKLTKQQRCTSLYNNR